MNPLSHLNSKEGRHLTIYKRYSVILFLIGLFLIGLAFLPELLEGGKKGFGYIQQLLLRNGLILSIIGMIIFTFPNTINRIINILRDKEESHTKPHVVYTTSISLTKTEIITLLIFMITANVFVTLYIRQERFIYFWDAAHFWAHYMQITSKLKDGFLKAIISVLSSIQYGDYNYLATFLLTPFSILFGEDRLPYILSIVNIYLSFASLTFLFLYKRFAGKIFNNKLNYLTAFFTIYTFFTFPFIISPIILGIPGIGGVILINLILFLHFERPFIFQPYRKLIVTAVLLTILIIFRRWYSFWVVSFIIATIINEMIFLFIESGPVQTRFNSLMKRAIFLSLASGILYIMIALPRLLYILNADYSLYSVYRYSSTIFDHLKSFLDTFGLFYIILTIVGAIISLYYPQIRRYASFLIIQWIITFYLYTKFQNFGIHHFYILDITILLFMVLFLTTLIIKAKSVHLKFAICLIYIIISLISSVNVFTPTISSYTNHAKILFPSIKYYPRVRSDLDEVKRMINIINGLLKNPNDHVYVLSSSSVLNSGILQLAYPSLKDVPNIGNRVYRTSDIDLKDGFPSALFKAKYVVVAVPLQCHVGCQNQRVVSIPATSIIKGEDIGSSYRKLPYEFTLMKNVKAYIYERIKPATQADIEFLSKALKKYYPDKPFVYQPSVQ
jgi:hypothetical protein